MLNAVESQQLTPDILMQYPGAMNRAGRLAIVGMFQARSHPEWELPTVGAPLLTTEEAAVHAFLAELGDTSVGTIYHAVRQLRYGGGNSFTSTPLAFGM